MRFLAYATLPYLAAFAGARLALDRGARELRVGRFTAVLVCVVAFPSVVGLVVPAVRHALERNAEKIADGEAWRLVTCLIQQDGGIVSTVANLFALLAVGSVAEHLFGGQRTVATGLSVGVLAQLPALVWQPIGAGNSVGTFGLAGALAFFVLRDRRRPRAAAIPATLTLLFGVVLTALADIHGPAVLLGAASVALINDGAQLPAGS